MHIKYLYDDGTDIEENISNKIQEIADREIAITKQQQYFLCDTEEKKIKAFEAAKNITEIRYQFVEMQDKKRRIELLKADTDDAGLDYLMNKLDIVNNEYQKRKLSNLRREVFKYVQGLAAPYMYDCGKHGCGITHRDNKNDGQRVTVMAVGYSCFEIELFNIFEILMNEIFGTNLQTFKDLSELYRCGIYIPGSYKGILTLIINREYRG